MIQQQLHPPGHRFDRSLMVLLILMLLLAYGTRAHAGGLPPDVAQFVDQRRICDHFREEPYDGDRARRAFVAKQLNRYCAGTDTALSALKRRYFRNRSVLQALEPLDSCVEAKSRCTPQWLASGTGAR